MAAAPAPAPPGAPSVRTLRRWMPVALIIMMVLSGFAWTRVNVEGWNLQSMCVCEKVIEGHSQKLDKQQEFWLPRMIYPQPNTLNQTRPDVLTMTPWFAPIIWQGTYNRDILNQQFKLRNVSIGLTVFAIKKYVVFLQLFLETAEKFFMIGHKVNYYVFTDQPNKVPNITLAPGRQIITLLTAAHKRWQEVTMRRMEMLHNACRDTFIHQVDYIVAVDVDMQFTDVVGVEILGNLFGTLHPGYYNALRQHFTYERSPASQACIPIDEGDFYYAGGFFGGTVSEVYKLTGHCHKAMMMDKDNGIEAIWHDESHLNKYFVGEKPSKILSPEYLWATYMGLPAVLKSRRFRAVPKNSAAIRSKRESSGHRKAK